MSKHADEPLCKDCQEDRPDMVTATRDGRRVVWHCSVCGKSWYPKVEKDVSGVEIDGP